MRNDKMGWTPPDIHKQKGAAQTEWERLRDWHAVDSKSWAVETTKPPEVADTGNPVRDEIFGDDDG